MRSVIKVTPKTPKPDRRAQARQDAFNWMRAVPREIAGDALRQEVGDIPDFGTLIDRAMGVCGSEPVNDHSGHRRGYSGDAVRGFLDQQTNLLQIPAKL
jgi:hypothetical protein